MSDHADRRKRAGPRAGLNARRDASAASDGDWDVSVARGPTHEVAKPDRKGVAMVATVTAAAAAADLAGSVFSEGWTIVTPQKFIELCLVMLIRDVVHRWSGAVVRETVFVGTANSVGPILGVAQGGPNQRRGGSVLNRRIHYVAIGNGDDGAAKLAAFTAKNRDVVTIGRPEPTNHPTAAMTRSACMVDIYHAICGTVDDPIVHDIGGSAARWFEVGVAERRAFGYGGRIKVHLSNPRFGVKGPQAGKGERHELTRCPCTAPNTCAMCKQAGSVCNAVTMVHSAYFPAVREAAARRLWYSSVEYHRAHAEDVAAVEGERDQVQKDSARERLASDERAAPGELREVRVLGVIDRGLDMNADTEIHLHDREVTVRCATTAEGLRVYAWTDGRVGEPRYCHPPTDWFTTGVESFTDYAGRKITVCYEMLVTRGDSVVFRMRLGDSEPRPVAPRPVRPPHQPLGPDPAPEAREPAAPPDRPAVPPAPVQAPVATAEMLVPDQEEAAQLATESAQFLPAGRPAADTLRDANIVAGRAVNRATQRLVKQGYLVSEAVSRHATTTLAAQLVESVAASAPPLIAVAAEHFPALERARAAAGGAVMDPRIARLVVEEETASGGYDTALAARALFGMYRWDKFPGSNPVRVRAFAVFLRLCVVLLVGTFLEEVALTAAASRAVHLGAATGFWSWVNYAASYWGVRDEVALRVWVPWPNPIAWAWRAEPFFGSYELAWVLREGWSWLDYYAVPALVAGAESLAWSFVSAPIHAAVPVDEYRSVKARLAQPAHHGLGLLSRWGLAFSGHFALATVRYLVWPTIDRAATLWSIWDVASLTAAISTPVFWVPALLHAAWNCCALWCAVTWANDGVPAFAYTLSMMGAFLDMLARALRRLEPNHTEVIADIGSCDSRFTHKCVYCGATAMSGDRDRTPARWKNHTCTPVLAQRGGDLTCHVANAEGPHRPDAIYEGLVANGYKSRMDCTGVGLPAPYVASKRPEPPLQVRGAHVELPSFFWEFEDGGGQLDVQKAGVNSAKIMGVYLPGHTAAVIAPDYGGAFISRLYHYPAEETSALTLEEYKAGLSGRLDYRQFDTRAMSYGAGWVRVVALHARSLEQFFVLDRGCTVERAQFELVSTSELMMSWEDEIDASNLDAAQIDLLRTGRVTPLHSHPSAAVHTVATKRDEFVQPAIISTAVAANLGGEIYCASPECPNGRAEKKNRVIVPSPPAVGAVLFTWCKALERWAARVFHGASRLVYTPALSLIELGAIHTQMVDQGVRFVYEWDGSNWDAYQGRGCQAFIWCLMAFVCAGVADPLGLDFILALLMPVFIRTPRVRGSRVSLRVAGWFEPSGRYTTTVCNTIRNLLAQFYVTCGLHHKYLAAGDDALIYARNPTVEEPLSSFAAVRARLRLFFGNMPVEGNIKPVAVATFCSKIAWPCRAVVTSCGVARHIWAPLIGRAVYKLSTTFLVGKRPNIMASLAVNYVALAGYYSVVPVLRVVLRHATRVAIADGRGAVPNKVLRNWSLHNSGVEGIATLTPEDPGRTWDTMREYYGDAFDWAAFEHALDQSLSAWQGGMWAIPELPGFEGIWEHIFACEERNHMSPEDSAAALSTHAGLQGLVSDADPARNRHNFASCFPPHPASLLARAWSYADQGLPDAIIIALVCISPLVEEAVFCTLQLKLLLALLETVASDDGHNTRILYLMKALTHCVLLAPFWSYPIRVLLHSVHNLHWVAVQIDGGSPATIMQVRAWVLQTLARAVIEPRAWVGAVLWLLGIGHSRPGAYLPVE